MQLANILETFEYTKLDFNQKNVKFTILKENKKTFNSSITYIVTFL